MNAKLAFSSALIAAVAGFAGQVFAETPTPEPSFTSTRTTAEVAAELAAYRQAGVNPWSTSYNPLRNFKSSTTSEAVRAEYIASRAETAALTGEDSGSMYLARIHAPAPRHTNLAGQPASAQ
jgi:hypothetical protein